MPALMKAGPAHLLSLAAILAALAIAGCGGGGGGSDATDPASVAPPDSLFFLEVTRPKGDAAANVEALAKKIAGVDDLGELIISELERTALDGGDELDFATEIEPWLGQKAAFFPRSYDGEDFSEWGAALETTDPGEAEAFLQKQAEASDEPVRESSYEGVDYSIDPDGDSVIGVIGELVAYGETKRAFEAMVDAADGDSLAGEQKYTKAVAAVPKGSVADLYVDVGGIVQKDEEIDSDARTGLKLLGIEPEGATAVASAIPGSDQIEINLSSDVVTDPPPAEDNSFLLGSMPADSVLALASSGAGEALAQAFDRLDREGIPDEDIKPGELKSIFKQADIDLDAIASSVTNVSAFVEGSRESNLGGAAVLIANSAQETVTDLGAFLRAAGVDGYTAIPGKISSGFSIRDPDLGSKPLVVLADEGIHLVVAYGLRAARNYFDYGQELADNPAFKEATASLDIPISGFADGPAALRLALDLVSGEDRAGLLEARPYLSKIEYVAIGTESTEELAKSKLILSIGE